MELYGLTMIREDQKQRFGTMGDLGEEVSVQCVSINGDVQLFTSNSGLGRECDVQEIFIRT